jgi:alpha-L-fucosidase 2
MFLSSTFLRYSVDCPIKSLLWFLIFLAATLKSHATPDGYWFVSRYDVTWNTPGTNENDSMPLGNGDLAANVWIEQNGDIMMLLAKADAWTELGKLVKLGRLRIHLEPNPFIRERSFSQTLELENGSIEFKNNGSEMRVWMDANHPVMHITASLEQPAVLRANLELWRTAHPLRGHSPDKGGMYEVGSDSMPVDFEADTVLAPGADSIALFHYNTNSIYPHVLEQQHLESLTSKYPDPLFHRCFGATLIGAGLISLDGRTLNSSAPGQNFKLDLIALTETNVTSAQDWQMHLNALIQKIESTSLPRAWRTHKQWWRNFWNRSWIILEGDPEAETVSQGYAMQRYMIACSSRGAFPVKFNGGLFTVGHDMPDGMDSSVTNHNPDFRAWGNCYWNQNNRLLYWPLIATGDYDLLQPWFNMYLNALPLEKDRTQIYYHHDGASFPETMFFWGLPSLHDFGWNNPSNEIKSAWQRYHIQGSLEVISQMLDYYDNTENTNFARNALVPFADAVITYYDEHWLRDAEGKIRLAPVQSLETYQLTAVNPTPDIAGLRSVIPRLLQLPPGLTTPPLRAGWTKTFNDLPPIPLGRTTANGKLPPFGIVDTNGLVTILPAQEYGRTRNSENPELYVAFPYHLYGIGKPGLELARTAYAARCFPQKTCWGQDGTESAVLGITGEAQEAVIDEFSNFGNERFPWFWKPAHDWIPDLDDGGSGMMTLQLMLMQCDGKHIILLPAWPENWSANFKLHAPCQTTLEGSVRKGKIIFLRVTPESRKKDVMVWNHQTNNDLGE